MYREIKRGVTRLTGAGGGALNIYPVGSVYIATNSTDPATLFGGTWVRFGKGRVIVGVDEADTDFDTVKETGGEKKHTMLTTEMPSHNHDAVAGDGTLAAGTTGSSHTHGIPRASDEGTSGANAKRAGTTLVGDSVTTTTGSGHTHNVSGHTSSAGGGTPHNILQPYITCYMWERTA